MYEDFFGLRQRPFTPAPQVNRYFPAETIEQARGTVTRCLQRAEGISLVVGPSGTGKTLLCQMLRQRFADDFSVAPLYCGRLNDLDSLYQTILFELGQPYRGMSGNELRLELLNYLAGAAGGKQRLVLLVDEAHTLSLKLLEELRMMMNHATDTGEPHVRILLVGGPSLEERFTHPKLEPFSQRIAARCYLEPFRQEETRQYIHAQVDAVGGDGPKLFTTKATKAVFNATDGIPRLINQVCDHALLLAAQEGKTRIDDREVEIAWADLQQLPTPWNDEPTDPASVVEFGSLDDTPCCTTSTPSTSSQRRISHQSPTTDDLLADLTASAAPAPTAPSDNPPEEFSEPACLLDPNEIEETVESILSDLTQESVPEELETTPKPIVFEEVPAPAPREPVAEPIAKFPSQPTTQRVEDPFVEEFESEEMVVQPLGTDVGRSPMVVSVDSPILTYTPPEPPRTMTLSDHMFREKPIVDVGYSYAPPSVRSHLTVFSPEEQEDDVVVTVNHHLSRIFATLRRA